MQFPRQCVSLCCSKVSKNMCINTFIISITLIFCMGHVIMACTTHFVTSGICTSLGRVVWVWVQFIRTCYMYLHCRARCGSQVAGVTFDIVWIPFRCLDAWVHTHIVWYVLILGSLILYTCNVHGTLMNLKRNGRFFLFAVKINGLRPFSLADSPWLSKSLLASQMSLRYLPEASKNHCLGSRAGVIWARHASL